MKRRHRPSVALEGERPACSTPETLALLKLAPVMGRDAQDRVIYWGQGTQALYGFSPEEALGQVSHELLHTRFPLPLEQLRARFLESGHWEGELVHTRKDGSQIVVLSEWVLQRDPAAQRFAVLEIDQDITARKQDEIEHATLAALVENSPDAVVGETLDGTITSWNPGAERLFGYSAPEAIGRHISMLAPPENPDDMLDIIRRVKAGEVVRRVAAERLCKGGRRLIVSLAVCPVRAPDGRIIGITKMAHDITERRQAMQALQQSEENLRTLFNSVLDGIVLHTAEGTILDANESWCRLHGASLEQARRLTIDDLSAPSMNQKTARELWAKVLAGEPQFFEWKSRRAIDHSEFEAEVYLRRIRLRAQDMILASVRDITQRKRDEEQRRLQSAALQSADNAIVITGRDGCIQWVNPAFSRLTGYAAAEVLGQSLRLLKSGTEPAAFYQDMWQTVLAGQVWRNELVNRRKDGSLYHEEMTITPVRDSAGAIKHFIAIKQDVTERKQAEQALRKSERRLRALFEYAGVGIVEVTADDHFIAANKCACEILGRSREELLHMNVHELTWPEDRELSDRLNAAVHAGQHERVAYEKRYTRGDGSPVWVNVTVSAVRDDQGKWVRSISTIEDITERKRAEEAARAAREALGQANAQLERKVQERTAQLLEANANLQTFAYTAAHDMRSPLRSIRGFSQLALEDYAQQLGPEGQSYLQKVTQSADQMARLLNDLLEYSKLSQAELRLEKVDLVTAAEDALALLQADIQHKGAEVAVALPLPAVTGHPATVTLVLTNLVSNALKFVPVGTQPKIRIRAEQSAAAVRVMVEDNGIGIDPKDQQKLFQPFQRLHGKAAYPGTGLGLAIVRRAVERMGGRVGLSSVPGQGSCFWAELRPTP